MPQILSKPLPKKDTPAQAVAKAAPKKKKEVAPAEVAVVAPPSPQPEREIVYHSVGAEICTGDAAIFEETAKGLLGWETEKEYQARMRESNPGTKNEQWTFGDDFMLKDEDGNKVRCWNNLDNRPFDEAWCRGLAQTILNGQWAGPSTITGETINGSTIVISRTGRVESGQHSLVAVVLATQIWWKNKRAYPFWENKEIPSKPGIACGPFIETIVITGISEHPQVLMTVDNCKQRSESDVFYTSELFRGLSGPDRKEHSRMMQAAVDLLWVRTGTQGYKTLPEVVGFQERHKKLVKAVEHLFVENSAADGRKIAKLRLSAGQASALCYLMGCSGPKTDGDLYRNGLPPSEKDLEWERWTKAKEFWALIGGSDQFQPVRDALGRLTDSSIDNDTNLGLGGRFAEKLAIIEKAWNVWVNYDATTGSDPFSDADLAEGGALYLNYTDMTAGTPDKPAEKMPDGRLELLDVADFKGIDVPAKMKAPKADPPKPPTKEEIERLSEEARKARGADIKAKLDQFRTSKPPTVAKPTVGPAVTAKVAPGKK